MAIVINGSGTVTGISVGGLPDDIVDSGTLASDALDSAVTINDSGADVDFRVESDTDAYALFVQGSDGNVGFGEDTPLGKIHIKTADSGTSAVHANANELIVEGNAHSGITILSGSTSNGTIAFGHSGNNFQSYMTFNHNDDALIFANPSERLRITNDGRGLSQFTAKAWINFNGTGTVAIRDSHNCSSLTDNGTGDYTVSFTNSMANVNYAVSGICNGANYEAVTLNGTTLSTSSYNLWVWSKDVGAQDMEQIHSLVFGD
jgi:hypothetical protein